MAKYLVNKKYELRKFPGKGGWTFAAIHEIKPDKKNPFGWVKVKGLIDDIPISNYHLMPMGNGQLFLPVKAAIRKQLRKTEGDWINVQLNLDNDPLVIPNELMECLNDEPVALQAFNRWAENKKATAIKDIYTVKNAATRAKKITLLIESLLTGKSSKSPTNLK
jgi:Domain of unknown function (DUF1905)/Bacteriocin-protection, YdeI or OmpD-Associated